MGFIIPPYTLPDFLGTLFTSLNTLPDFLVRSCTTTKTLPHIIGWQYCLLRSKYTFWRDCYVGLLQAKWFPVILTLRDLWVRFIRPPALLGTHLYTCTSMMLSTTRSHRFRAAASTLVESQHACLARSSRFELSRP